jgi:hypothetical protein
MPKMCVGCVRKAADDASKMSQGAFWSSGYSILPSLRTFHIEPLELPVLTLVCGTYGAGGSYEGDKLWPLSASGARPVRHC